jgi:hypothetical protein
VVVVGIVVGASVLTTVRGEIVTLNEPTAFSRGRAGSAEVVRWLRENYTGGRILAQGWGNEYATFASHIPLRDTVYEGSYQQWEASLADPAGMDIEWVYMSAAADDEVRRRVRDSAAIRPYTLVFSDGSHLVYRRTDAGTAREGT